MKKAVLTIIIIACCLGGVAQNATKYDKVIKNAPFIFEGKVLKYEVLEGEKNITYVSYVVQIEKIFRGKGQIKNGTIELVAEAPENWHIVDDGGEKVLLISDNNLGIHEQGTKNMNSGHKWKMEFNKGTEGIFFCASLNSYPSLEVSTNNSMAIRSYCSDGECYINIYNRGSHKLKGLGKTFKTKQEIYEFLGKHENITIPKEDENKKIEEQPVKKKDASGSLDVISKENQIKYAQRAGKKL